MAAQDGSSIRAVEPEDEEATEIDSEESPEQQQDSESTGALPALNFEGRSETGAAASDRPASANVPEFRFPGKLNGSGDTTPDTSRWADPEQGWIRELRALAAERPPGNNTGVPGSGSERGGGLTAQDPEAVLLSDGGERSTSQNVTQVGGQDGTGAGPIGRAPPGPGPGPGAGPGGTTQQTTTQQTAQAPPGASAPGTSGQQAFAVVDGPGPRGLPPLPGQPGAEEAVEEEQPEAPDFEFNEDGSIDFDQVGDPAPFLQREGKPTYPIEAGKIRFLADGGMSYDKDREVTVLEDSVELFWEDVIAGAERVEVDQKNQQAQLQDKVFIRSEDDALYADTGFINYDTGFFHLDDIRGNSGAPLVNGRLYFTAKKAEGTLDEYRMRKVRVTTCEPWCNQDYTLYAKKVRMKPGSKAVLRHVYLYINQQKVMYFPIIAFPLRQERFEPREQIDSVIRQNYGYNERDGAFARYAYTYSVDYHELVSQALLGVAMTGFTTQHGNEYGLRQDFFVPTQGAGTYRTMLRQHAGINEARGSGDPQDIDVEQLEFNQEIHWPFLLDMFGQVTGDMERRVRLSGRQSKSDSANWDLRNQDREMSVSLSGGLNRNFTIREGQDDTISQNVNTNLQASRELFEGATYSYSQDIQGTKTSGEGDPMDTEGDQLHQLRWSSPLGQVQGRFGNSIDYDRNSFEDDQSQRINDPKPEVSLAVEDSLIPDWSGIRNVSFAYNKLEHGQRNDLQKYSVIEGNAEWGDDFAVGDLSIDNSLRFEQELYNDGNQRFSLRPSVNASFDGGEYMNFDVNWNQRVSEGAASPLATGAGFSSSNRLNYDLRLSNGQSWQLRTSGGFDYADFRWNPLNFTLNIEPTETGKYGFRISTGYDVESGDLNRIRVRSEFTQNKRRWNLRTNMTLNPDGNWVDLSSGSLRFTHMLDDDWAMAVESNFRKGGNNTMFDRIRLAKYDCCSTWTFSYQRQNREFQVSYTVNAFPGRSIIAEESPEDDLELFAPYYRDLIDQTPLSRAGFDPSF